MSIEVIGRLHYLVSSRTRAGVTHLVDLEPQDNDPYFCGCEAFNENEDYHGKPCPHIRKAVRFTQTHTVK